jgi:hypothetical protein
MKKNYILFLIFAVCCLQMYSQTPCTQENPAPVTSIIYTNPERGNPNVAFDLVVDAYTQFELTTIEVKMATANLAVLNPTGIVSVYDSDSGNLPGTALVSETIAPTVVTDAPISTFGIYTVTFNFSSPVVLDNSIGDTAATFWVGFVMGNVDNGDTGVTGGDLIYGQPYAVINDASGSWALGDLDGTYTFEGTCLLSVDEFEMSQISVSPNPTTDFININMPNNNSNFVSELFDITGKLALKTTNLQTIDVSELHSGIYILRIKTDNGMVSKRIIKQ